MYFLFTYIQSFLVMYMVVASFGATTMCLFEPVSVLWPRLVSGGSFGRVKNNSGAVASKAPSSDSHDG
jgi:hypothetical protein